MNRSETKRQELDLAVLAISRAALHRDPVGIVEANQDYRKAVTAYTKAIMEDFSDELLDQFGLKR